jgi:hypothetical protein
LTASGARPYTWCRRVDVVEYKGLAVCGGDVVVVDDAVDGEIHIPRCEQLAVVSGDVPPQI